MNWSADHIPSILVQLTLVLTMVCYLSQNQTAFTVASDTRHHKSQPKRHISSVTSGFHALWNSFDHSFKLPRGRSMNHPGASDQMVQLHQETNCTGTHNTTSQQSSQKTSSSGQHLNSNSETSTPPSHASTLSGHSTTSTTVKPLVSEQEKEILNVYHNTIAHVTQISTKIAEINQHLLTNSLDVVAASLLRFDEYLAEVDSKTKDCKFNSDAQVQRIRNLLQQKLKTSIAHCMTRESSRLDTYDKNIRDELNKYNNVILLQVKNILMICNKMQGPIMKICLDKSWQICTHVNDKFLATVNGFFSHALLVYNQSNGVLGECLKKDAQANKKYFHWAIKLFRTANCKNLTS